MNDVSILFPLPSSAGEVESMLAPSAVGDGGTLFPEAVYTSMGFVEGSTQVGDDAGLSFPSSEVPPGWASIAAYGNLRVVAMRIDPCFASLNPDPSGVGCTAQIRLVFQEVQWVPDAGAATGTGAAVQAFYELSRAQFLALARALVALRVANESGDVLGPLAPHPIIVRQGLAGPMSQGVQALVLAYAGEQNLVRAAKLSRIAIPAPGGLVSLSAYDLSGRPLTAVLRSIPTLGAPDGGAVAGQLIESYYTISMLPPTTSSDDYSALIPSVWNGSPALSSSMRQAALDALVRVENPQDNSPNRKPGAL